MRDVTIKYDQVGLYSPDCFTRELQPHTSEITKDLKEVFLTFGPLLNLLIMLLLLLWDWLTFWKRGSLLSYTWLLQITEYLQLETTDSTKKIETPGAVLHKLSQERRFYRKLGRQSLVLVRGIQNIDVYMKNLISTATDLVEPILFWRHCIAFLEGKTGHF